MGLGSAIRQLRKSKEITLAELAERAGSHVGNLSRIERGTAKPSLDLLYRLSDALGFTLAEIFSAADKGSRDEKQVELNSLFISLLDDDRELLVDFARLLHERACRDPEDVVVDDEAMPLESLDGHEEEDEGQDEEEDEEENNKERHR